MADEKIPGSWIGREVVLARAEATEPELVTVREVNDLGLACTYASGEVGDEPVFIPWSFVSWMRPSVSADQESSEAEDTGESE